MVINHGRGVKNGRCGGDTDVRSLFSCKGGGCGGIASKFGAIALADWR